MFFVINRLAVKFEMEDPKACVEHASGEPAISLLEASISNFENLLSFLFHIFKIVVQVQLSLFSPHHYPPPQPSPPPTLDSTPTLVLYLCPL